MSSLTKRSVPRACSSITKAKMTSCVPSRGMSVSVDLASLGAAWGGHSGPLRERVSPLCALTPHQGLASGSQTPLHPKYPGPGCLEGRRERLTPRIPGAAPGMRARLGVPGKAQVGEGHVGFELSTPGSPSLLEGRARVPAEPAQPRHLHLMSVLHMRLARSLDTTMQMTRTKMRKFTCGADSRAAGGLLQALALPSPPQGHPHRHSPQWQRGWAAG